MFSSFGGLQRSCYKALWAGTPGAVIATALLWQQCWLEPCALSGRVTAQTPQFLRLAVPFTRRKTRGSKRERLCLCIRPFLFHTSTVNSWMLGFFWNKQNSVNTICFWQNEQHSLKQKQQCALKYLWKNNRLHKNITKAEVLFSAKTVDRIFCMKSKIELYLTES